MKLIENLKLKPLRTDSLRYCIFYNISANISGLQVVQKYWSRNILFMNYGQYCITSTLTAIIFVHYRVPTKMALEILGYTMCWIRLSKLLYTWLEGSGAIFLGCPRYSLPGKGANHISVTLEYTVYSGRAPTVGDHCIEGSVPECYESTMTVQESSWYNYTV